MRKRKLVASTALLLCMALGLSACASFETNAYKAIQATETLVDAAMKEYGVQYAAHQTTPDFDAKVKDAYQKYQAAALTAVTAVQAYSASQDQSKVSQAVSDFQAAATSVITLIQKK